jgi:hypothetical protein
MASVLSNTPDRLAVALFGRNCEFYRSHPRVLCRIIKTNKTDTPENAKAVMTQGIAWLTSQKPRAQGNFGPIFGLSYRLFDTPSGQTACYVLHEENLGNRENPTELLATLSVVSNWLTSAGVS